MEKHIYLVRHGQSESNADGIMRGHEAKLTDSGREQAMVAAERIKRIGVDSIISSPFPRAHDTAFFIGERVGLPVEVNELFSEWSEPSLANGKHRDHPDVRDMFFALYSEPDPAYRHEDEETFLELLDRAKAAEQVLKEHPASRLAVVSHGGFLTFLTGLLVFKREFNKTIFHHMILNMSMTNTGITYLKKKDEKSGWVLMTWNDQSHLG